MRRLSTAAVGVRATRSDDAGPYRDAPNSYGKRTEVAKDGTFRPYTILTATLKEGESAPVVPAQRCGPKKGFADKPRACGCAWTGPHKSTCAHYVVPKGSDGKERACGCAGTGRHKKDCEHYAGFKARGCGCAGTGPHKSSCSLSRKAKRKRPGAGPIQGP